GADIPDPTHAPVTLPIGLRSRAPGGTPPAGSAESSGQPTPGDGLIAIVPVTGFRAAWDSTNAAEVSDVLLGKSTRFAGVEVIGDLEAPTMQAIGAGHLAGGNINLDGAVAYHVKQLGLGVDFPFDGGTATITAHYCCSFAGTDLPRAKRTGNAGAVRDLLSLADLSIANFENPAPNNFQYHP